MYIFLREWVVAFNSEKNSFHFDFHETSRVLTFDPLHREDSHTVVTTKSESKKGIEKCCGVFLRHNTICTIEEIFSVLFFKRNNPPQ